MTLDFEENNNICKMVEIKCPVVRTIEIQGDIDDVICPHYYWI